MAWGARSGLKLAIIRAITIALRRLNGLGSPFGIETVKCFSFRKDYLRLNGLGSPFGIETIAFTNTAVPIPQAKWPGEPVRD